MWSLVQSMLYSEDESSDQEDEVQDKRPLRNDSTASEDLPQVFKGDSPGNKPKIDDIICT